MGALEDIQQELREAASHRPVDSRHRERRNRQLRHLRLKLAKLIGDHTDDEWQSLVQEFDSKCVMCGAVSETLQRDHIQPVIAGGSHSIANIQPLCVSCNPAKGTGDFNWKEYRRTHGWGSA